MDAAAQHPDFLIIVGIDADLAVIERTGREIVHAAPALAFVVGAENASLDTRRVNPDVLAAGIARHHRINDGRILAINRQADAAKMIERQSFGKLFPALARVGGFVDRAAGAVARIFPGRAKTIVHTGIESIRI